MSEPGGEKSLEILTAETFRTAAPAFTLHVEVAADGEEAETESRAIPLELDRVDGLTGDTPRADAAPFSVVFRSREGHILPQAIYRLDNESVGRLDLFLVCLGPDPKGEGSLYEAIFT